MAASAVIFLLVATLGASEQARADSGAPELKFERYHLANGLEVILHQDNQVPLVAVELWYHVGSGDEVPGRSGFAHLFEHMLFQGSVHVGEDKHFEILKTVGASSINGTTNTDRTNYYEVVPSHQLETALWMESDRMGYFLPKLTQTSLDNQIEVVRNERRQNYDDVPYRPTTMAMYRALYPQGHPYRNMTIGLHEDLTSASLDDVKNFYKKWYVPANATLALAGDFDTAEAKKLIEKWFGSFPRSDKPRHRTVAVPASERHREQIVDKFAKLRRVTYAWHTPALYKDGDAEFDILGDALSRTGTGRLYKILVHEKQLAQSVRAGQSSSDLSSRFIVEVTLRTGASLAEVERIIDEEIEKLRTQNLDAREVHRAVTAFEVAAVWRLESLRARTEFLQRYNHSTGEPGYLAEDLARYTKATPDKIRDFASRFLSRDKRVELITVPAGQGGGQ